MPADPVYRFQRGRAMNSNMVKPPSRLAVRVRERILQLRDEQGMSSAELARRAGIDQSAVYQLENGISPTLPRLEQYARALGVPPSELVSEDEPEASPEERRLLSLWRQLSAVEQAQVEGFLQGLLVRRIGQP